MSHVSFSAPTGSHVKLGDHARAPMSGLGAPQQWWRSLWSRRESKVAEIRRLMHVQVEGLPDLARRAALEAQIAAAERPETLWALRDALTQMLVEVHGATLAQRRMTDITFMFAGLLHRERSAGAGEPTQTKGAPPWTAGLSARGLVRSAEQVHSDH